MNKHWEEMRLLTDTEMPQNGRRKNVCLTYKTGCF